MARTLEHVTGLPSGVTLTTGEGGLLVIRVDEPAASGEVYLQGAHVAAWTPAAHAPVLWMSSASEFADGVPIRGGVPICFPWFGAGRDGGARPAHGFARRTHWELGEVIADDGGVHLWLDLANTPATRALSPHSFEAIYRITFGADLTLALDLRNTGDETFSFEEVLHTYLAAGDVVGVTVRGLEDARYLNTVPGAAQGVQRQDGPIRIAGETDRIYVGTTATVSVQDAVRTVTNAKENSASTVVWNPWIAKAAAVPDFGSDEWPWMLCVETANVRDDALTARVGGGRRRARRCVGRTRRRRGRVSSRPRRARWPRTWLPWSTCGRWRGCAAGRRRPGPRVTSTVVGSCEPASTWSWGSTSRRCCLSWVRGSTARRSRTSGAPSGGCCWPTSPPRVGGTTNGMTNATPSVVQGHPEGPTTSIA